MQTIYLANGMTLQLTHPGQYEAWSGVCVRTGKVIGRMTRKRAAAITQIVRHAVVGAAAVVYPTPDR